jgi:hypothetical protein
VVGGQAYVSRTWPEEEMYDGLEEALEAEELSMLAVDLGLIDCGVSELDLGWRRRADEKSA